MGVYRAVLKARAECIPPGLDYPSSSCGVSSFLFNISSFFFFLSSSFFLLLFFLLPLSSFFFRLSFFLIPNPLKIHQKSIKNRSKSRPEGGLGGLWLPKSDQNVSLEGVWAHYGSQARLGRRPRRFLNRPERFL